MILVEYTPKKKSEEMNLKDVQVEDIESTLPNSVNDSQEFSESDLEEKFEEEESSKKKIVLELPLARKLLTEKRREILETLSEQDFDSITELTEELGRDKKNVSQDIKKLYEHGLIDLEDQGRSKKPVFEFRRIEVESLRFPENMSKLGSEERSKKSKLRDKIRKEKSSNKASRGGKKI